MTLLADSEKRVQAFETKCPRKLVGISYMEHKTNDWVRTDIKFLVCPQESLLAIVKGRNSHGSDMLRVMTAFLKKKKKHRSGHFGGWATSRSAEEMLDGQHQTVDIPGYLPTRAFSRKDWKDVCPVVRHVRPTTRSVEGLT